MNEGGDKGARKENSSTSFLSFFPCHLSSTNLSILFLPPQESHKIDATLWSFNKSLTILMTFAASSPTGLPQSALAEISNYTYSIF